MIAYVESNFVVELRWTTVGRSWRRDLYQYDLHCLQTCSRIDYRDLDLGAVERTATSTFSSERTLSPSTWKIADVGTGKTWVGTTWNDSWALADESCSSGARWMRGSGNDYNVCISGYDARNGIGPWTLFGGIVMRKCSGSSSGISKIWTGNATCIVRTPSSIYARITNSLRPLPEQ